MSEQGIDELLESAPAEEYVGQAVVAPPGGPEIHVEVQLRGHFEPLDGRFHWYGRIATNAELAEHLKSGATVTLRTPHSTAEARLSDVDPWGRFRVAGTGRPPF